MHGDIAVSVDRDFARFGGKTYAINKINSVEVRARHPYGTSGAFLCGLVTVICFFSALNGGGGGAVVLALIFGGLAVWSWRRSKTIEYQLFLMTSSSEAQAIVSRDGAMIDRLGTRIENAMSGQLV